MHSVRFFVQCFFFRASDSIHIRSICRAFFFVFHNHESDWLSHVLRFPCRMPRAIPSTRICGVCVFVRCARQVLSSLLCVCYLMRMFIFHPVLMMCVSFFCGAEIRALRKTPGRHPWRLRRKEVATGNLSRVRRKGFRQQKGTQRLELIPRRERLRRLQRRLSLREEEEKEEGEEEGGDGAEEVEEDEEEGEGGKRNSSRRR